MGLQLSLAVRNAMGDILESSVGASAILKIYDLTAGAPADCAAAITGTILSTLNLPSDWMLACAAGVKAKTGTWQDTSADAPGTADFFRIFASDGVTCHHQGTITATGGGGDMTLDNTNIAAGQQVTITGYSFTMPHA